MFMQQSQSSTKGCMCKGYGKDMEKAPTCFKTSEKKCSGACLIVPEPNLKKGFMKEMVFSFLFEKEK